MSAGDRQRLNPTHPSTAESMPLASQTQQLKALRVLKFICTDWCCQLENTM